MNKVQFLNELSSQLKNLKKLEREDILQDYEEHFRFGEEEGKTEEEIAATLGSPKTIAKEILANYHIEKVGNAASLGNIMRALWAVIGLGFFNLMIVLAPFIALVSVILSGWLVSIIGIFAPLLIFVNIIVSSVSLQWFSFFLSLAYCGLGIFLFMGMQIITKVLIRVFVRYLKFNASLVKGGLRK
ncbi:HAAS signaling domain-containing protein [Niallia sp. 01092]|uniref:HAAS signaling domain-containing protein n=1 Tax=unclassified Niallia TaxID=2837522 RepID=UPI003FD2E57A